MISIEENEYLTFLSKYFSVSIQDILEKSIENNVINQCDSLETIVSKLKSVLGFQRRLSEPLEVAFSKTSPFDTIVKLVAFTEFEKHISFLIADSENILRLLYFFKEERSFHFKVGSIVKIDSCYYKDGKLMTNKRPKNIWFYDFPHVFMIREYFLDNLPECIYDEDYSKRTKLVTIIGYFLNHKSNDKLFCFIYSKELQIRIIPYKIEEINNNISFKLVKISYCELGYGSDAFQLKMTEFSELTVLSKLSYEISKERFKKLIRFEYPTIRMSLSELTENSVACTKVKVLNAIKTDNVWKFYGFDSSQAVCMNVYDEIFANNLEMNISDQTCFLINGIYKRGKNYYVRERIENIEIVTMEEEDEILIPISKPNLIDEEKLVIIDILVTEILERTYISKEKKQEKYEKIKALSSNIPISINCYNKTAYHKFLPGCNYRFYFVRSKFYNNNLYFIYDSNSFFNALL